MHTEQKVSRNRCAVLVTYRSFEPGYRGGGPVRSLARIVDTLPNFIDLWLICRDRDVGSADPYPGLSRRWIQRGRNRIYYLDVRRLQDWLELARHLRARHFSLLYVNSLWDPLFALIPILAVRLGVIQAPIVLIAPRGQLSDGALGLGRRKKRLALAALTRILPAMAVRWHASTHAEASEITSRFAGADVYVVRDQFLLPTSALPVTDGHDGPARFVFISRISPKKNLMLVLEALRHVRTPCEFDIYGPVEDLAYWSRCQVAIQAIPKHVRVLYRGELHPDEVRGTFARYDVFTFPTLGENFGHVVVESLSAACPVICSSTTAWSHVLEAGGGLVLTDCSEVPLAEALDMFASKTSAERIHSRRAAAVAYEAWREHAADENILETVFNQHGHLS